MGHIVDNAVDVGSLCFLSVRSKTNTRSVSFFDYHIYHHPLRPVKTDSANVEILTAREVAVCGSYWCICRRCWASFSYFPVYSKPTESFVTYFPIKRKNPHLFYSYGRFPRKHSVTVKQLNASADFAYWVIFLAFSSMMGHFSRFRFPKKKQPAFITKKSTAHSTFQLITVFRDTF